mmetsp:Transcript_20442/g.44649  ORF Transcript_20442/g.44649 Transcript_20442/m.44649 type:complete len:109 (-) Transcript_20442:437-763(-)
MDCMAVMLQILPYRSMTSVWNSYGSSQFSHSSDILYCTLTVRIFKCIVPWPHHNWMQVTHDEGVMMIVNYDEGVIALSLWNRCTPCRNAMYHTHHPAAAPPAAPPAAT